MKSLVFASNLIMAEEPAAKRRFGSVGDTGIEEMLKGAIPTATSAANRYWLKVFDSFCRESEGVGAPLDFSVVTPSHLASVLEKFYPNVRKQDGTEYRKNSLLAARSALHRHLTARQPTLNLFTDGTFSRANKVLDAVLKDKKSNGREPSVEHKRTITDDDWKKIADYFGDVETTCDPRKLSSYVWFLVSSHFCLRGGEIQAKLRKQDLKFEKDGEEVRIILSTDFMTKNHRGGLKGSETTTSGCIKDPTQVRVMERYLGKLHPGLDRLFQRAACSPGMIMSDSSCWFYKSPLSHNKLDGMMKLISESAALSFSYTNHCLRATSITHMKRCGVEDRKICTVTGHKNVNSLAAYDRVTSAESRHFADAIDLKVTPPCAVTSTTESKVTGTNASCSDSVASETFSAEQSQGASSVGFVLNAQGANFSNVVFNVTAPKPKKRFCLSLKERRRRLQIRKEQEN